MSKSPVLVDLLFTLCFFFFFSPWYIYVILSGRIGVYHTSLDYESAEIAPTGAEEFAVAVLPLSKHKRGSKSSTMITVHYYNVVY